MQLRALINGVIYEAASALQGGVEEGASFSEEYNETLDSGSIIIDQSSMITNLHPYDDVIIWDASVTLKDYYDQNGFSDGTDGSVLYDGRYMQGENITAFFFKHLLVDQFTETMLNLGTEPGNSSQLFKYTIKLFSETKGLETVQLPNLTVTEPLAAASKISIYDYMQRYVSLYSPKCKYASSTANQWEYKPKYTLDSSLSPLFSSCYSPDFVSNWPTLRDFISKLMIAKDCIPYVRNGAIFALNITERTAVFSDTGVNTIQGSLASSNYCNALRTNYTNSLAQFNSGSLIERMGFRNSGNALMTVGNMNLEAKYPIYRINRIYLCYYKRLFIHRYSVDTSQMPKYTTETKMFLCKQDITPLVKLDTERNALSQDWLDLSAEPTTVENLAKYKMCTVGYSIGSKSINGWGTKYTYPEIGTWWDITKTYVQNIAEYMDRLYPLGIYDYPYIRNSLGLSESDGISCSNTFTESMIYPLDAGINEIYHLKSLVFEMEYQPFFGGTTVTSKDGSDGDSIVINDNQQSSLALLEKDGLYQKEKINRFGNKGLTFNARYADVSSLQPLGSVYNLAGIYEDVVIYHREYSIWGSCVNAVYYGMKDYVLKNYYTSVYAKYRTWSLMPYGESVQRSENRKSIVYLSSTQCFSEAETAFAMSSPSPLADILSAFSSYYFTDNLAVVPSDAGRRNYMISNQQVFSQIRLNHAYFSSSDDPVSSSNRYASDSISFVDGYSLCFNVTMPDNISAGNYIRSLKPNMNTKYQITSSTSWQTVADNLFMLNVQDDYTGSVQGWYKVTDDYGQAQTMSFYLANVQDDYSNAIKDYSESEITSLYSDMLALPLLGSASSVTYQNTLGAVLDDEYKDNRSRIDVTYQIEPLSDGASDVFFSQYLMKLSDMLSLYKKWGSSVSYVNNDGTFLGNGPVYSSTIIPLYRHTIYPTFLVQMTEDMISSIANKLSSNIKPSFPYSCTFSYNYTAYQYAYDEVAFPVETTPHVISMTLNIVSIDSIDSQTYKYVDFICDFSAKVYNSDKSLTTYKIKSVTIRFKQTTDWGSNALDTTQNYHYFSITGVTLHDFCDAVSDNSSYITCTPWGNDLYLYLQWSHVGTIIPSNIGSLYMYNTAILDPTPISNLMPQNMILGYSLSDITKEIVYNEYPYSSSASSAQGDYIFFDYSKWPLTEQSSVSQAYAAGSLINYNGIIYMAIQNVSSGGTAPSGSYVDNSYWRFIYDLQYNLVSIGSSYAKGVKIKYKGIVYQCTADVTGVAPDDPSGPSYWSVVYSYRVADVFSVSSYNGLPVIKANLSVLALSAIGARQAASMQYWYWDNENDSYIKFVFGVNLSASDWAAGYKNIYISLVSDRERRVYDYSTHQIAGYTRNYAYGSNSATYGSGTNQYYDAVKH
jgi:hypothetical protein